MSGARGQRLPPGHGSGRGPSFFDSFFGGDPFAHMDSMFRSMGVGGDLFGGPAAGAGTGSFQTHRPSSTAREIPIEGPDGEGPPSAQRRLTGPLIDELPDHEQQGHEHLFFSSPDHVEEPEEEEEPFQDPKLQQHPPYHMPQQPPPPPPQQQQQQQAPQPAGPRPAEPRQQQAAPVPPPPWQSQQRYNSSSSSGGGEHSAEELLAAMGSLPLGTPQSEPPGRPKGWAAGGGGGAEESEGPGSPLLVHTNTAASPFSPQRGAHLLDADRLPPHLPPFGSLGSGSGSGGIAGGGVPHPAQPPLPSAPAAAAPPVDWLAQAFGAGMQAPHGQQAQQVQQAAAGRPVSWEEHAGMFVTTPVSSAQPPAAVQPIDRSPGGLAAAAPTAQQQEGHGGIGGGGRSASSLFLLRRAGAEASLAAASAAQQAQPEQRQLGDGAAGQPTPQQRQRRLPAKLREAVEAQLQHGQAQQHGTAAGRQRRAAAGRKRRRGSSEEEEADETGWPAVEEEDPDWAVPRRPRAASAGGGRVVKHGRRGSGGRASRGRRR